jgi:DNA sulfur modification protein DndB
MSFLESYQLGEITRKLTKDSSKLGKIYKAKKNPYQTMSVDHSLVDGYLNKGWELDKELKTKTKLIKKKKHSRIFEDKVWCQFYELGYRYLNFDDAFILPFGKDKKDTQQIDVIAIDDDTVFIVECESSEKLKKAPPYQGEFDLLRLRLDGFKKSMEQVLNKKIKVKYIFATKNLRMSEDSYLKKLKEARSFYYNDNTYLYIQNLIKSYKDAARYQFLGLVFKNEKISDNKIEVPAIEGDMGGKKYYMFSIEPNLLLKIGFVLHRAKANESDFPTYQRLLIPSRLKKITHFIDNDGYFPNSIIVNFSQAKKAKLNFEFIKKTKNSSSKLGILKIPNAYAIAYIIDGQHRLYGYANSKYLKTNTIPVVAFDGLESVEQLKLFMDINENQKAVSADLRLDLEEDLFWDSPIAASRMKALRSSIIKQLGGSQSSPLYNKISIGEERRVLHSKPFSTALSKSGLLPNARGNKYDKDSIFYSLYDTNNHNHNQEMESCKKQVVELLNLCYEFVETEYKDIFDREKYFIISDRGSYAFITLIGSLNRFLIEKNVLSLKSSSKDRFIALKGYLNMVLNAIQNLKQDEENSYLSLLGSGADIKWLRFFQSIVNSNFSEYEPLDLIDWKERQSDELQNEGRCYGESIESHMKQAILENLKKLFGKDWDMEIGGIKRKCMERAEQEREKAYKDGLGNEKVDWQGMFNINDYKTIIENHWSKNLPDDNQFKSFQDLFSIDVGLGFNSKSEKVKWISQFNKYRNLWAHTATKGKRLNKEEVFFLKKIHNHFKLDE